MLEQNGIGKEKRRTSALATRAAEYLPKENYFLA